MVLCKNHKDETAVLCKKMRDGNDRGDAPSGAIATRKELTERIRFTYQVNYGGIISPFNAWLINRGSVTLPLRMRQHNASAPAIAKHLESLRCP